MPLRVYRRPDTGTIYITGTVRPAGSATGYRVRQRAGSDNEAAAREEAAAIELQIIRDHHLGAKPAERGFAAAVTAYLAAEERSPGTEAFLEKALRHFGNAKLSAITQEALDDARTVLLRPGAAPSTVNRNIITPIRAVLSFAAFRGWCEPPKFKLLREPKGRTAFLLPEQFETLHQELPARLKPLATVLVCTGCRLGELLAAEWSQVDLGGAKLRVWADQAKTEKERVVRLTPPALAALASLPSGREGHVFRSRYRNPDNGELLPYRQTSEGGGGQIGMAFGRAAERAGVPWATPHILRHTFASWHWAIYHDLIALRDAGGWSSVELVERYAHLTPAGQEPAIRRVWGLGELVVVKGVA